MPDDDAVPGHAPDDDAGSSTGTDPTGAARGSDLSIDGVDDPGPPHERAGGTRSESGEGAVAKDVSAYTTDVRTISPRVQLHWAVRMVLGVGLLAVLARWIAPRIGINAQFVLAGAGGLAVLGLAWVHLRYRVWCYELRDDALYLERGVITHVRTVAPHVRIQHVDTSRSPIERSLGLSTLVVYTAGSRGADVSIPGLTPDRASDLQRRLKELAIESEGGDAL